MERDVLELTLLAAIRALCPSAVIEQLQVQPTCGCYSEYTTEAPSVYLDVRADVPEDEREAMALRSALEYAIRPVIAAAYTWSWCSCCAPDGSDDYSEAPMPHVYLLRSAYAHRWAVAYRSWLAAASESE